MKRKFIILLFPLLIINFSLLISQNTWIIDLPYQDLYPETFSYPDSYNRNVIPAIGGGYLATAFVNPGVGPQYWREMLFWKVNNQGEVEWRKQDTEAFENASFTSMVSNGVDRYYAMSYHSQLPEWSVLYVLDDNCDVISTHNYLLEDDLRLRLYSIKLLDDGLIMVGQLYEVAVYAGYVILRTDLEGNIIWIKDDRDFGVYAGFQFDSVITTSDNGFLSCGHEDGNGYLLKFNAEGDTLWTVFRENSRFHNILEYEDNIFLLSYIYDGNPSHTYLIKLDLQGNFIEESLLLDPVEQTYTSSISVNQSGDFIILYNSVEGEIHNVTPTGNVLWSYDYFIYSDDLIGSGADNLLIDDAGYYVYNATIDEWTNYPGFKLIRTDPYGIVPVEDPTISPVPVISLSNYPNPFNPSTTIEFSIQNNSDIELSIYNIKGQKIKTLLNNDFYSGKHSIIWNGEDENSKPVSSGIYYYKLNVNGKIKAVKKCLLLK